MKQCMDSDNLHRRLKKIIGQVQAIDKMIVDDIKVHYLNYTLTPHTPIRIIFFHTPQGIEEML